MTIGDWAEIMFSNERRKGGAGIDYLDGYGAGGYRWILSVTLWRWQFIVGRVRS